MAVSCSSNYPQRDSRENNPRSETNERLILPLPSLRGSLEMGAEKGFSLYYNKKAGPKHPGSRPGSIGLEGTFVLPISLSRCPPAHQFTRSPDRPGLPVSQTPCLLLRQGVLLSRGAAEFQLALSPRLGRLESSDPLGVWPPSSTHSRETFRKQPPRVGRIKVNRILSVVSETASRLWKKSRLLGITCPCYRNAVSFG